MVVPANFSIQELAVNRVRFVLNGAVQGVRLVVGVSSFTAVDGHGAIAGVVVAHASAVGAVDRDLVVVGTKTMAVGVGVVEEAALEHAIVAGFNSGNQVTRREGGLFGLSEVVFGVAVEGDLSDGDQRVVLVGPDFGDVEDIEAVVGGFLFGHCLHVPGPTGVVALGNLGVEVVGGPLGVNLALGSGLLSGEVLDALVSFVVRLDVVDLSLVVDPLEGVGGVSVHVAVAIGGSAVAHQDGDLVEGLGGV